ncbi:MAG: helix-turn-helix transcriptional regulator [Gammaproteobacteria bacterium]|nr:helix-turn-helix transcriptional regulator [Gammaproteobacteria bacterium]
MSEVLYLNNIIGEIYDASYNPNHWPVALKSIATFTHSDSAALLYHDNELKRASGMYSYNIPEEIIIKYNAYGRDPSFEIIGQNVPIGQAGAVDHIIPDRKRVEQIYGDEYVRNILISDIYHIGGAILFMDDVRSAGLALQRKQSSGVWEKDQIENLNLLTPHIQRALKIQKEFVRIQTREQALQKGLDKLLMGMVLFDQELQPIYINPVAGSILKYHPAIELKNNKFYACYPSDTDKIYKALRNAVVASQDSEPSHASATFGIKHPDVSTTLPLVIAPVKDVLHDFERGQGFAYAAMCFSDPEKSVPIEAGKLVTTYQLTPAEARVAISIANGLTADKISSNNNVSVNTVRSQLKNIYKKLGVNSQTELVKILLTGPFL